MGDLLDDDALTEAWEATLQRSVSHEEHVRVARVLVIRHGRDEARRRLVDGTLRNCIGMNVPDRFDKDLTARWSDRIADCVEAEPGDSFEAFAARHSELLDSGLLGPPSWKREISDLPRPR